MGKFQFCSSSLFLSSCSSCITQDYMVYTNMLHVYRTTALLLETFLSWFGATCKLQPQNGLPVHKKVLFRHFLGFSVHIPSVDNSQAMPRLLSSIIVFFIYLFIFEDCSIQQRMLLSTHVFNMFIANTERFVSSDKCTRLKCQTYSSPVYLSFTKLISMNMNHVSINNA